MSSPRRSSPRRAGSFGSVSPRRASFGNSSPPYFSRQRSGSGKDSARRSGSFGSSSNSTKSSPNAGALSPNNGAFGAKFRAAAKKAIAANRVRDAQPVAKQTGKPVIVDYFEEPMPVRSLHEVFLDSADEDEEISFKMMCNLSTMDISNWKVRFQHHHPEGVKANWMSFRIALSELAAVLGVSFDHIVGQIIWAPTTFMVNEMTAKQVAAVYGTYCDEVGRIKPGAFLRMLRHCRILDGDLPQDLGDARHLDIAVADSIFRAHLGQDKDRGLSYMQFTKAILAIADHAGVPHLRISQNIAGRAKVLAINHTAMKYVVPKRQIDNALFYTTNTGGKTTETTAAPAA